MPSGACPTNSNPLITDCSERERCSMGAVSSRRRPMNIRAGLLLFTAVIPMFATRAQADITLTVGPGYYKTVSAAVTAANADTSPNNYYVINVEPGTYTNDFPEVT